MTRRIIGFVNPDGSGVGNWSHVSEHQVGRIKHCKRCGGPHMFPSYQATPSPDGPSLLEIVLGVAVLLVWFVAIFWALPILATAMTR